MSSSKIRRRSAKKRPFDERSRASRAKGRDRHEAVHAVATIFVEHMGRVARGETLGADPNASYFAALEKLTIANWRRD